MSSSKKKVSNKDKKRKIKKQVRKLANKKQRLNLNDYGVLPIKRTKFGPRHPHVVVLQGDLENISVGLSSKNARGDLIKVKYSNGESAFMKRTASRLDRRYYDDSIENYKLDKISEEKAYQIAVRKMLKDIGKEKSNTNKKRNH